MSSSYINTSFNTLRGSLKSFFKDASLLEKLSSNNFSLLEQESFLDAASKDANFLKASNREEGLLYTDAVSVLIKHLSKNDYLNKSKVLIEPSDFSLKHLVNKDFTFSSLSGFDLLALPSNEMLEKSVLFWSNFSKDNLSFLELEEKNFSLSENIHKQFKKRKLSVEEVSIAKSIILNKQDLSARLFCLGYSFEPNLDERLYFENIFGMENLPLYFEKFTSFDISFNSMKEDAEASTERFKELEEQIFLFDFSIKEADTKNSPIILLSYLRALLEMFYSRYNHPHYRPLFKKDYYGSLYSASKNIVNISLAYFDKILILEDS